MRPTDVLRAHRIVLLDFDGPVCAVFGGLSNQQVADELRGLLDEGFSDSVASSRDPFDVLKYAAEHGNRQEQVEGRLRELEVRAVASAPAADGAGDVLEALRRTGHHVIVVSNNSEAAVVAYLEAHGFRQLVDGISARTSSDPGLLKPDPFLLHQALSTVDARGDHAVMIGDSVSDVIAAGKVGAAAIGYANKPGKRERLNAQNPAAVIDHMTELIA